MIKWWHITNSRDDQIRMPKQGHRAIPEKTLLAIAAIFLFVGIIALGFLQTLSRENRALIVIFISVGMIVCLIGLMSIRELRKWLRKRIWRRAMSAWTASSQAGSDANFSLACQLSEIELRELAIQVFVQMGYIIRIKDGQENYIRMINPEGRVELVSCKHRPDPVGIRDIYDLQIEMKKPERFVAFIGRLRGLQVKPFTGPDRSQSFWWLQLPPGHPIVGRTLAEVNLRARTGASVIAILRKG